MPFETIVLRVLLPDVDHLRAGVGLLAVVGERHRVELADRVVALEDAARVLPGDRRARLDLGPGDLRAPAEAAAALGDEVVDAALAVLVARVPVLHRRVLDLGVVERDELDHRGVELVLVALRRRAALEVADVGALVGDDQRALELAGLRGVDAEVGGELHRAAHALRHVDEGAVAEDRGVERREEVVRVGHHRAQVLLHQLGVLAARPRRRSRRRCRASRASSCRWSRRRRCRTPRRRRRPRGASAPGAGCRASRRCAAARGRPRRGSPGPPSGFGAA